MEDAHLADVHPHLAEGVFAVFDGHNGPLAAEHLVETLIETLSVNLGKYKEKYS